MGEAVVYIVTKSPRPGQIKTRLCPPLAPREAADLAAAFLRDTIALAARAGVDVRLIVPDAAHQAELRPIVGAAGAVGNAAGSAAGAAIPIQVQRAPGLGDAMESAFVLGPAAGYRSVVVIGTDCPSLPPDILTRAFDRLRAGADVALGPSHDGGYYLLAARQPYPSLFRDMEWSTPQVARETLARCAALGLQVALLDSWPDVDDIAGLRRLAVALAEAAPDVAPHTRAVLQTFNLDPV